MLDVVLPIAILLYKKWNLPVTAMCAHTYHTSCHVAQEEYFLLAHKKNTRTKKIKHETEKIKHETEKNEKRERTTSYQSITH